MVSLVTDTLLMARDVPGSRTQLDAQCRRLEVDNANCALHGAAGRRAAGRGLHPHDAAARIRLIDDEVEAATAEVALPRVDLSALTLPVIAADADEVQARRGGDRRVRPNQRRQRRCGERPSRLA